MSGYDLSARRRADLCPVPDCDGPWGTCDLHYHRGGCASEWRGDDCCTCGLTGGSAPNPTEPTDTNAPSREIGDDQ